MLPHSASDGVDDAGTDTPRRAGMYHRTRYPVRRARSTSRRTAAQGPSLLGHCLRVGAGAAVITAATAATNLVLKLIQLR